MSKLLNCSFCQSHLNEDVNKITVNNVTLSICNNCAKSMPGPCCQHKNEKDEKDEKNVKCENKVSFSSLFQDKKLAPASVSSVSCSSCAQVFCHDHLTGCACDKSFCQPCLKLFHTCVCGKPSCKEGHVDQDSKGKDEGRINVENSCHSCHLCKNRVLNPITYYVPSGYVSDKGRHGGTKCVARSPVYICCACIQVKNDEFQNGTRKKKMTSSVFRRPFALGDHTQEHTHFSCSCGIDLCLDEHPVMVNCEYCHKKSHHLERKTLVQSCHHCPGKELMICHDCSQLLGKVESKEKKEGKVEWKETRTNCQYCQIYSCQKHRHLSACEKCTKYSTNHSSSKFVVTKSIYLPCESCNKGKRYDVCLDCIKLPRPIPSVVMRYDKSCRCTFS